MRLPVFFAALTPMFAAATPANAPLLSPIFGEHMVLQRGRPNTLWGWAKPGTHVALEIAGHRAQGTSGSDGRWQANIDPPEAGGPYTLKIDGPSHLELQDVLVGDVWLCGGQSNMAMGLAAARDGANEVSHSENPGLRLFYVQQNPAYTKAEIASGVWRKCEPASFGMDGGFSAVAYYFGLKIQQEIGVPVGLIQDAVGGSPAESWMSPEALKPFPEFNPALEEIARLSHSGGPVYGNFIMHWFDQYDRGVKEFWSKADLNDSGWILTSLRGGFAALGVAKTPAVAWFRRDIELPAQLPHGEAKVLLGVVEKMDTVFINGKWIGASSWVENPRAYTIPAGTLQPGKNQVTLRVLKIKESGGFLTPAEDMKIKLGDGQTIPLEGEWHAALGADARPPHPLPLSYDNYPTIPATLHLGMLSPLSPLSIRGAIWYQGEANTSHAEQYRKLLPALIADWRKLFAQPELPFYIVGLPAFMKHHDQPGTDGWAELRQAQAITAHTVPHTGLAITIDTGEADNIHPLEKKPVGDRLARLALRHTYGRDIPSEGPTYERAVQNSASLRLHFRCAQGGLIAKSGPPAEFDIAGEDRVWHRAEVRIDGNTVIVSSEAVPNPIAARYAWQSNPIATLTDSTGLPAAPFRTDDWPLSSNSK